MTILEEFHGLWMVQALGWTLLHFCWQGALVAAALWCALVMLRGQRSQLRYAVACCGLALMAALPVATFAHLAPAARRASLQQTVLRLQMDETVTADGSGAVAQPLKDRIKETLDAAAPWLPAAWLTGVALFLVRLSFGLAAARRMKTGGTQTPPLELQLQFERLRVQLGLARAVRLLHSAVVQVPTVIGWLRPVVLMPVSCLTGLSAAQLEAVLCHELAHIRRHDYLVSVLQSVVEALLFYHPAVWWVSRQIRRERECCCDELAVAVGGNVLAYARALSFLEEQRSFPAAVVLGANGGVLKMRIKRLLGSKEGPVVSMPVVLTLALIVTMGMGAYLGEVAYAQRKASIWVGAPIPLIETQATALLQLATGVGFVMPEPQAALAASASVSQEANAATDGGASDWPRGGYKRWLDQDVRWIITPQEAAAFRDLKNDEERDKFIEQFWVRRDPPGAAAGTFREEIYQGIAYANENFATDTKAGWSTDRGHLYILYGKPDVVVVRPKGMGGYPFQTWQYKSLPGIGDNVYLDFVDTSGRGDYRYTIDSPGGGAQNGTPNAGFAVAAKVFAPPQVHAAQATGDSAIEGTVFDPVGAVVRKAKVTSVNTDTGVSTVVETDDNGKYSLSPLPAGPYNVEVEARGFQRMLQENVHVRSGEHTGLNFKLTVGAATESLTVTGTQTAGVTQGAPSAIPGPARVSAGAMAKQVISQPAPVYPPIAKAAHVQGVVVLHAIISKTGTVEDLHVISGSPMLTTSALEAVKQWTYKPYVLNGQPVAAETIINVNFTFGGTGAVPPPPPAGAVPQAPGSGVEGSVSSAQAQLSGPLKVSAGVVAGLAISQPQPVYPPEAKAAHIQGTVMLHALISKVGEIENLQVISGPEELVQSTLDAVNQWKYKPFLLNGEPTEVETTINVTYTLDSPDTSCTYCPTGPAASVPVRIGPLAPSASPASVVSEPNIRSIEYKGLNSVTIEEVEVRLRGAGADLRPEAPYDVARVARAAAVLKQLLAEHRHPNAIVTVSTKSIPPGAIGIQFSIKEGPKGPVAMPSAKAGAEPVAPAQSAAASGPQEYQGEPVRKLGGDVTAPMLTYKVDPEFTDEARKSKFMGVVLVNLIVDAKGRPQNVHVLRGVGMGLDENAVKAVQQYRFKPAGENGKSVPVLLNTEVNFQIF